HNIDKLSDLDHWADLVLNGAEPVIDAEDAEFVGQALALLPEAPFGETTWTDWVSKVKEATGRKGKGLFMPLRKALTGQAHGPEMADLLPLLHKIRAKG
ncbi:MAG TPA: glutamate--tRNA ligase, partial [Paenirhodobacter sp.]